MKKLIATLLFAAAVLAFGQKLKTFDGNPPPDCPPPPFSCSIQ